jgi:hypothetical protein
MNDKDFAALVESIKEAGEIKRGQQEPSRVFELMPPVSEEIRSSSNQSVAHKRPSKGEDRQDSRAHK